MEKVFKKVLKRQEGNTSNLESENSELSRTEKIKKFLDESKKGQTLYANCEGSYNRRIVDINNQRNLKQFIYCNLFYNENFYYMETDEAKSLILHEIVKKMVNLSKQFATPNEIHFSIIWVYYYEYESGETKITPLFKIYKTTNTEEAVFLDIFLNTYGSWEYYLENAVFSKAFLCVPRNGNYTFTEKKSLDLIYVTKKEKEGNSKYTGPLILPFFERVLRKLLSSFSFCSEYIKKNIKSLMNVLKDVWEDKNKFMAWLMLLLKVFLVIYSSVPSNLMFLPSVIQDFGLMFSKNVVSLNQDSELTPPISNGNISFDGPVQTVNTDDYKDLIAGCRSFVDDLPSSKYTTAVKYVLSITEIILKVIRGSKAGLLINGTKDEIAPLTFSDLQMRTNTEISPNSTILKKCSSNLEDDKVKVQAIQLMLNSLEEIAEKPFETIRGRVYEEAKSMECREIIPRCSPLTIPDRCDIPGKFYIFTDASLPVLAKEISLIFNNFSGDWSFKPINDTKYHVIDSEGRVLGKLYCIEKSFVLGHMIED